MSVLRLIFVISERKQNEVMIENLAEFYERIGRSDLAAEAYIKDKPYFTVQDSACRIGHVSFSYRDFYKVALVLETGKLYYADKWIMIDRPALMFSNPMIPYAWEAMGNAKGRGCFCIFNEAFIEASEKMGTLADTPLFNLSKERIYFLNDDVLKSVTEIFDKMRRELQTDYSQKLDILRCYVHLMVHEAMKAAPTSTYVPHKNAAQRIAELFLTLLDRQFPIEWPKKILRLKSATDFADRLSIHVNHLNRVVKATTGRTTSDLINSRIAQEGVQLLQHSRLSISEIAYSLGFEELSSFSNFIKKRTGSSPTELREVAG